MKIKITDNSSDAEKLEFVKCFLENQRKAGIASAAKLTPEQRRARARKAVMAREAKKHNKGE